MYWKDFTCTDRKFCNWTMRAHSLCAGRSASGLHYGIQNRSIKALTSVESDARLARWSLLSKPSAGWRGTVVVAGTTPQHAAGPRTARGSPPHAMADMPDLSHLTPEERAIIEGVIMRQKQEEQREHEIMRCVLRLTPRPHVPPLLLTKYWENTNSKYHHNSSKLNLQIWYLRRVIIGHYSEIHLLLKFCFMR